MFDAYKKSKTFNDMVLLFLFCFSLYGCDSKSYNAETQAVTQNKIGRIKPTEVNTWLNKDLLELSQLESLHDEDSRISKEKCSNDWFVYSGIYLRGWPREDSSSGLKIYTYKGKISIVIFYPFVSDESIEHYHSSKGTIAKIKDLYDGSSSNHHPFQELENLFREKCSTIFDSKGNDIGQKCADFSASMVKNYPFDAFQATVTENRKMRNMTVDEMVENFQSPRYFSYVQSEVCAGCYGKKLVFYKNHESLLQFLQFIHELNFGAIFFSEESDNNMEDFQGFKKQSPEECGMDYNH